MKTALRLISELSRGRFLTLAIIMGGCVSAFTQNQPVLIPWNDNGLNTRMEFSGNYSWRVYQVIDNGSAVAFLSQNDDQVLIYRLDRPEQPQEKIEVPSLTEDFYYSNGNFYAVTTDAVVQIARNDGRIVKSWALSRPEGMIWVLHRIYVVDNNVFLLTADEKTWLLNGAGLSLIDDKMWKMESGYEVRTEVLDVSKFRFAIVDYSNKVNKDVALSTLGLPGDLVSAIYCGTANGHHYIDIETSDDSGTADPRRFVVALDDTGALIFKYEIPFVYFTSTYRQIDVFQNSVYYAMSAPEGVYICDLSGKTSPFPLLSVKRYHFNEHLPIPDTDDSEEGLEKIGNNCVTRTQVLENARQYLNLSWVASSANYVSACTQLGSYPNQTWYLTPSWVNPNPSPNKTSTPYKWNGFTRWNEFRGLAAQGRKCGNRATTLNNTCTQPANQDVSDNYIIGVDCSGFISRVWERTSKLGTSNLPGICTSLGASTTTTGFNALNVGDIVNTSGHVRLCIADNPTGSASFIESSADFWNVRQAAYSMTSLTGYTSYEYKDIINAYIQLAQAISISPNPVNQGCPLTVTYKITNVGSESWTGTVQLVIVQSNGNEVPLQTSSAITLGANQSSPLYTFTSPSVSSPTGSSKLEVRIRNSTTTCNYGFYYKVGGGGYNNPLIFNIGSSCNSGTCSAPTGLNISNIGQTSCTISWGSVSGAIQYKVYQQNPSGYVFMGSVTGTSVNITSMSAGTYYCFAVKTVCANGESGYSTTICLTTSSNACGTSSNIWASNISQTTCTLSWSAVSGASHYWLYYWNGTSWVQIGGNFTYTSANISGMSAGNTYCFRVRAVCGSNTGGSSRWTCVTTAMLNSSDYIENRSSSIENTADISEKGLELEDIAQLENKPGLFVRVSPNPVYSGMVSVEIGGGQEGVVDLTLYDLTGRMVLSRSTYMQDRFTYELDLQGIESGLYLLKVSIGSESHSERIVVIR